MYVHFKNVVLVCLNSLCNSMDFCQEIPGVHRVHDLCSVNLVIVVALNRQIP